MTKIRLALVDDHPLFTAGLSSALNKEEDIQVHATFTSGYEFLDYLKKSEKLPDLAVIDISMPEINGLELIKKIKEQYPSLKILVASMFKPMMFSNQAHGYLSKDSEISEFFTAIRQIVLEGKKYFKAQFQENSIEEFTKSILTRREKDIIQLIAKEFTVDQIAEELFISRLTVETHKKNIFYKLKVHTNAGLIQKAIQLGYLS